MKYRLIPVFTVTLAVALVMLIGGFLLLHSFAGWNGNQIIILLFAFEVLILIGWWVFADRLVTLQIHTSFGLAEARRKSENLPHVYRYYCPRCLYQTNKEHDGCPKCGGAGLRFTESRRRSTAKVQET